MSNEQKLANYITETIKLGKDELKKNFVSVEIKKYNLQNFEPYDYKQVKEICKRNNIKLKKINTSIKAF